MRYCLKSLPEGPYVVHYCYLPAGHKEPCDAGTHIMTAAYICNMCDPPRTVYCTDKLKHEVEYHGRKFKY